MEWLSDMTKQQYITLRLYAPEEELVMLSFNPLKESAEPDWNPAFEEWHSYPAPLYIYKQDYQLLLPYFAVVYPTKDAFDGTPEPCFDICSYNWLGKADWERILDAIRNGLPQHPEPEQAFLTDFVQWTEEALQHTTIIVVEGNQ